MIEFINFEGQDHLNPSQIFLKDFLKNDPKILKILDSVESFNQIVTMCNKMLAQLIKSDQVNFDI